MMKEYHNFLAIFPCIVSRVLFFQPSLAITRRFLCLSDGQLVDLDTCKGHASIANWWEVLEKSGISTDHCRSLPLDYIKVNETNGLSLAQVKAAVIRHGAENVSIASLLANCGIQKNQDISLSVRPLGDHNLAPRPVRTEGETTSMSITSDHRIQNLQPAVGPTRDHGEYNLKRTTVRYRGSSPASPQELALYALLEIAIGGPDAYRSHATNNRHHQQVAVALHHLFPDDAPVAPSSINSYFIHAHSKIRRHQLGKYDNSFRWNVFHPEVALITEACEEKFRSLISNELVQEGDISDTTSVINQAVAQACLRLEKTSTNEDATSRVEDHWQALHAHHKQWRMSPPHSSGVVQLCMFLPGHGEHAIRHVTVDVNKTWTASAHGRICDLAWADLPEKIMNEDSLRKVMTTIEQAHLCNGCSLSKYAELLDKESGKFFGHDKELVAEVDNTYLPHRAIRTVCCTALLPNSDSMKVQICNACQMFDSTLRKGKSRLERREGTSRYTPYITMSKEELVDVARASAAELRKTRQDVQRLLQHKQSMQQLSPPDNKALTTMFHALHEGVAALQARMDHPICKWHGCKRSFDDVKRLHEHSRSHVKNMGGQTPHEHSYKCQWEACSVKPFRKAEHLTVHLYSHTGREDDRFLHILLGDQAKCLNGPKAQMRWHPAVIRWCLQMHARSKAGYEDMRSAGFLQLPTARTLQEYGSFSEPKSGWNGETMSEMVAQFNQHKKTFNVQDAHVGVLCFDEVKIKEGLLWDHATDKLRGFVDYCSGSEDNAIDLLATHINQFYFKSLFSPFSFPCAYFLTKNVTAAHVTEMFWTGLQALHDHGFSVLAACGDGASYNRTFFRMNAAASEWESFNPWSQEPIFFISDPPHLMKN